MTPRTTAATVLTALLALPAWAAPAPCSADIEGSDAMQFNKSGITVPTSCKQFTVKLTHVGKLPKTAMGHNWVLSRASDMQAVANDGVPAGPDKSYLKPGDARVIAHTRLLGGGESDAVTFDVASLKAGENYAWFCSFPGHSAIMKGTLALSK